MDGSHASPNIHVSIAIPAINEAQNLAHVLPAIPTLPEIVELILVDGGSTDETIEVARACLPGIRVVHQEGTGKSDAVRCGVLAAVGDFVLVMDADGSHDPADITRFIQLAHGGYDLVKGSRYLPGGGSFDDTPLRRTLVRLTDTVANVLWGSRLTDIVFGMFLIQRQCFLSLGITSNGFAIESQIMARAVRFGYKICEIPVIERARFSGSSHLSIIRDGWFIGSTVFAEFGYRVVDAVSSRSRARAPSDVGTGTGHMD
jgi:glycosyltransferase involved in cell wall biosynthesis